MKFTHDFSADFDLLSAVFHPEYRGLPAAFSRFGDGEYAILRNMVHVAKSDGWKWDGRKSEMQDLLLESLVAGSELDDYFVGISAANHHPLAHKWYIEKLNECDVPIEKVTFASLFIFANYDRFLSAIGDIERFVIVGSASKCDYQTPSDPADSEWPHTIVELANELASIDYTDAILVAAGPWSSVLIHRYWQITKNAASRRQSIIDVGSSIAEIIHGRRTRKYQLPSNQQRLWIPAFSENPQ